MLTVVIALVLLVAAVFLAGRWAVRSIIQSAPTAAFFYPQPTKMPGVVEEAMQELLARLESHLRSSSSQAFASLRPGLSEDEINALEAQFDIVLTDDLRALYLWKDGSDSWDEQVVLGHRFMPLEEALQARADMRAEVQALEGIQRAGYLAYAGHRDPWVSVFVDLAGDGYFYDPGRRESGGYFFFHFAEVGEYIYFPSLKNFLAGVNACYDSGIYHVGPDGAIEEDFNQSREVWKRYGSMNQP